MIKTSVTLPEKDRIFNSKEYPCVKLWNPKKAQRVNGTKAYSQETPLVVLFSDEKNGIRLTQPVSVEDSELSQVTGKPEQWISADDSDWVPFKGTIDFNC